MWQDSWAQVLMVLLVGAVSYAALVTRRLVPPWNSACFRPWQRSVPLPGLVRRTTAMTATRCW